MYLSHVRDFSLDPNWRRAGIIGEICGAFSDVPHRVGNVKFPPYNRRRNCSISGTWSASAEWGLITGTWFPPRYIRVMAIRTCAFFGLLRSGTQTAPVAVGVGPRFPPYRDGWWNRATSSIGRSNGARSSRMATSLTSPFGFAASSPDSAKQVGGNQTAILA